MLPDPAVLAATNARRMASVLRDIGGPGAPVAGGWMSCDQPGSWANYAAGLGVDGPVAPEAIDELIAFYARHGRPAVVEVTPYQHRSLFQALAARRFVVADLETLVYRPTTPLPERPAIPGLRFRRVDPDDPRDIDAFVAVKGRVFHDDPATLNGFEAITRRALRYHSTRAWLVEVDGVPAGCGALELHGTQGHLFGGGVLPAFRRRGLQQALIVHRVAAAAEEGAEIVLVGSDPGGTTERNALRLGFRPAYTQMMLKRDRPTAD